MKPSSQYRAQELRKAGYSYSYISKETGIGKGTLSYWLAAIPYTPNPETIESIGKARAKSGQHKSFQKQRVLQEATELAKKDIGKLSKRDIFMLGLGIYIGEGTKTNDQVRVVNSDPQVIRASIGWFKKVCGMDNSNFVARIHAYPDTDDKKALEYWSRELQLPAQCFFKPQIDKRTSKSRIKKGKLPFGTLHLTIRSNGKKEFGVFLARKITSWMSLALQQAGIV
jgi:hypothetical protein